ncbi:hypothetical protein LZ30DRAFT_781397 [Colletotrichum cereale]|nr:hypothetical protein LZ30DRAFT_781397 [Colletotrichum cereale]
MAPSKPNEEQRNCILFFENDGVFIGGDNLKIGYDNEIRTSVIWSNPVQTDACVGLQLCIPTRKEPEISSMRGRSAAQVVDTLNIKIKFTQAGLGCIDVNTPDSFQGQESLFMFYVMTAKRGRTTGHVANRQRSVVGITKHTELLCVVGDIKTRAQDGKKTTTATNEDGTIEIVDLGSLKTLMQWFKTKNWVAIAPWSDWTN